MAALRGCAKAFALRALLLLFAALGPLSLLYLTHAFSLSSYIRLAVTTTAFSTGFWYIF
jgi:hypothetical protein